jgi:hypothetical protein
MSWGVVLLKAVIPGARDLEMKKNPVVLAAINLCGPRAGALNPDSFEEFYRSAPVVHDIEAQVELLLGSSEGGAGVVAVETSAIERHVLCSVMTGRAQYLPSLPLRPLAS